MFGLFGKSYPKKVVEVCHELLESGKAEASSDAPFRLKKDEHYIFSVGATLGTYKNNGNFGYAALTGRVKVAKGVSFRIGGGKMGMQKSWVFDQPGELHVTTQRIVFDGINKNSSILYTKMLDMVVDDSGKILYVDFSPRRQGSDLAFKLNEKPELRKMATAFLFQKGLINLTGVEA